MNSKKIAAGMIITVIVPIAVDMATEPYENRGIMASWAHGAAKMGIAIALLWAQDELSGKGTKNDRAGDSNRIQPA